jgi:hypothetical protein
MVSLDQLFRTCLALASYRPRSARPIEAAAFVFLWAVERNCSASESESWRRVRPANIWAATGFLLSATATEPMKVSREVVRLWRRFLLLAAAGREAASPNEMTGMSGSVQECVGRNGFVAVVQEPECPIRILAYDGWPIHTHAGRVSTVVCIYTCRSVPRVHL